MLETQLNLKIKRWLITTVMPESFPQGYIEKTKQYNGATQKAKGENIPNKFLNDAVLVLLETFLLARFQGSRQLLSKG